MSVAIIIPSRYQSERLPGKALEEIGGKPLVLWVYDQCKKVEGVNKVIIATDHEKIEEAAKRHKASVVITSQSHKSGTDRCAEVANNLHEDYVINVQGDEPFIDPKQLENIAQHLEASPHIQILTLFHRIDNESDLSDPSKVKLTLAKNGKVLYFSRSKIPFERNKTDHAYYKHVGIYAFKKSTLLELTKLPISSLEATEGLEQLRWLEAGYEIYGLEIDSAPIGVDTPEDLERARAFAKSHY